MEKIVKIPKGKKKCDLVLELIEKNKGIMSTDELCKWLYGKPTRHNKDLLLSMIRSFPRRKRNPISIAYLKEENAIVLPKIVANNKDRNLYNESIVKKAERQASSKLEYMNNFTKDWLETDTGNKIVKQTIKTAYISLLDKLLDVPKLSLGKPLNGLIENKGVQQKGDSN